MVANANLPFFRGSWIADYADAENHLALFLTKNHSPMGPNYTHFSNKDFDALYDRAISINDMELRHNLYRKMDSIIINKAPIVPLYYDEVVRFTRKNINGLGMSPTNMLNLKNVKKD